MSSTVNTFIWAACTELQQATSAEACAHVLQRTIQVLRLSAEDLCELGAPSSAASEALQRLEVVEGLLNRETAAGLFWPDQLVFGRPFDFLAEVLLSGAAFMLLLLA